jgi:hypothetical protein
MGSRESWSVLLAGAATIWLPVFLWLSLFYEARGLDPLAIALALPVQLGLIMAWDLFPRLPLWIVFGHGLIMISLALGLVITVPGSTAPPNVYGVPWFTVGLVPAGVAMMLSAALRWRPARSLAH